MNDHTQITHHLHDLPPELPAVPDRLEQVRARHRRGRQRRAIAAAGTVAVLALGVPVALNTLVPPSGSAVGVSPADQTASPSPVPSRPPAQEPAPEEWGVNEAGQTYGAMSEQGTPDLVAVVADNGRSGYAFSAEYQNPAGLPVPVTIAQMVVQLREVEGQVFEVPVYESDGTTRIGTLSLRL